MDDRLSTISPVAWILEHKIYNESGIPIDFRNHLFLLDIYEDQSPKLVCYKAAQIGFSTMAIIKSLWLAKMKGMDIIYTMPTANDVKDFVGGKINRIINQNPVLLDYVKDKDSVEQKQVGDNIIYYRGTWTEKAAIAVSSDLNIHDEEDRSKQAVIQQYSSRLQHSRFKWEWHFSNPSVEGNGVSRYWAKSDQKHWFITCNSCKTEQYLSFPESINKDKRCFQCKACFKELTNEERRVGRWVRKFKDKEFSGYWISLLMAPWITANDILNYHETKSAEYFANFVLGLPYVGEGNQVTPDLIFRNCTQVINSQERIVIGCDSGLKKHYVLGNKEGIFHYGKTETWETIENLLKDNPNSVAVIDALPDLTEPRRLQAKYRGRVFLCYYQKDRKTQQIIRWGEGEELGSVKVDRNRGLQMVIDDFTRKMIPLQGNHDDWNDYYEHWKTLYKVTEVDDLGQPESKWETSNGMDHWCHATLYWRVAMDRFKNEGGILFTGESPSFPVGRDILLNERIASKLNFSEENNDDWRNTNY